jgi:hypothetical protein
MVTPSPPRLCPVCGPTTAPEGHCHSEGETARFVPEPMSAAEHKAEAELLLHYADKHPSASHPELSGEYKADILAAALVHAVLFAGMSSGSSSPAAAPWGAGPYR